MSKMHQNEGKYRKNTGRAWGASRGKGKGEKARIKHQGQFGVNSHETKNQALNMNTVRYVKALKRYCECIPLHRTGIDLGKNTELC